MSETVDASKEQTDPGFFGPEPQVIELRVHGVSGTPPEAMLEDPFPRQVAGDDVGRFFRRGEPISVEGFPDRDVEAYHWGRFTSGSPTRALWLLLLPFAVVNLARFALLLPTRETEAGRAADERRWRHKTADALLRLIGLVLTLAMVVTVCYVAWEIVARQCSGAKCAGQSNGMAWFGDRSDGTRVLVASIAPAAVLALVWSFGRSPALAEPPGLRSRTAWSGNGRVGDPDFWNGAASAPAQRAAHVWASCAVIGVLALATVGNPDQVLAQTPAFGDVAYLVLATLCGVGLGTALEFVIQDHKPATVEPDPRGKDTVKLHWVHGVARWVMAVVAAGCVVFAWRAIDTTAERQPGRNDLFAGTAGLVGTAAGCLLVLLLLLTLDMAFRIEDSRRLCRGGHTDDDPEVPPAFRPYWRGMGSWMLAALAVTLSFGFSTATVFWVAGLLGDPVAPAKVVEAQGDAIGAPIEIAAGYWTAASVWGGLVVVAAASVLPTAAWLLRRRPLLVTVLVGGAVACFVVAAILADEGQDVISSSGGWFVLGGALLAAAMLLVALPDRGGGFLGLVKGDYDPERPEAAAEARVLRQWRVAMARYRYHHAIGLLAGLGGLATICWAALSLWELMFGDPDPLPSSWSGPLNLLTSVGVAAASAIAGSLLVLGVATWRNAKMRTTVGILWDMVSFWPRVAHPLCPLPYGGRAVRAVAKRASELANEDLSEDHDGRRAPYDTIVLSGHSQGSVIVEAACAVLKEEAGDDSGPWIASERAAATMRKTCLVTYGSQIQFIYARLFPSYFGYALQREMYAVTLDTRWRNIYRWTDPLGGPVLSWPHVEHKAAPHNRYGPAVVQWNTMGCTEDCTGHPAERVDGPEVDGVCYRRWTIGPDIRLRDPGLVTDSAFAARLPPLGHSGYPSDRGFDVIVATLATEVDRLVPECAGQQPLPQQASPAATEIDLNNPASSRTGSPGGATSP